MLLMNRSRTSSIMAEKEFKMADLFEFFAFYVNKSTSSKCFLFKFVMHVTNKQFLDKFNNGRFKIQNGRFILIFRILCP